MKRYINEKIDAWKEHGDRFTCQHKVRELRTRIVKGGAKQYVYQCQGCGEAQMQPVARAKAYDLYDGQEWPSPRNPDSSPMCIGLRTAARTRPG